MSQWHREHPELTGTAADPWMVNESYRKAIHGPDVMAPADPPDDPPEVCEECGAVVQDTAAVDRECWRCGEAL